MEGYQLGGGRENRENVRGLKSIIGRNKIDRGAIENSIRNREAREFICTTHGHELM